MWSRTCSHVLNYLGIISVGGISVATGEKPEPVDAAEPAAGRSGKNLSERYGTGTPIRQEAILADNRGYFRSIVEENRDRKPGRGRAVGADGLDNF